MLYNQRPLVTYKGGIILTISLTQQNICSLKLNYDVRSQFYVTAIWRIGPACQHVSSLYSSGLSLWSDLCLQLLSIPLGHVLQRKVTSPYKHTEEMSHCEHGILKRAFPLVTDTQINYQLLFQRSQTSGVIQSSKVMGQKKKGHIIPFL